MGWLASYRRKGNEGVVKEYAPQNDFNILAALSHSESKVAGQKASRWIFPEFAASTLILAKDFAFELELVGSVGAVGFALFPQPKNPVFGPLAAEELVLLSHEGKKAETRCMPQA